ncbi:MAG: hypothetical protein WB117_18815, partial [Candidatus Acidiferrales bacterium]
MPAPAKTAGRAAVQSGNQSGAQSGQARASAASASVGTQAVAGEERRRSQRVLLRVRASIHVALKGKPTSFDTTTLSVNSHGALVILQQSLPADTRLVLEHSGTRERVACKVVRPSREIPEGYQI